MSNFVQLHDDEDRDSRRETLLGQPWIFTNLLPFDIKVVVRKVAISDEIGLVRAHSDFKTTKSKSGLDLKDGDGIHIIRTVNGKDYEVLRPVFLFDDSRMVKIGDIVYEDMVSTTPTIDIHHDIVGLRIHNHISMPIDVYFRDMRIGSIAGDDGTDFMAGSPNSVYLDNNRFGFNIGDELRFTFPLENKPYATMKIIDNFSTDIILGRITQKFVPMIQDQFAYRVNKPNITGLRFFDQVTGYESFVTSSLPRDGGSAILKTKYQPVAILTQGVKL